MAETKVFSVNKIIRGIANFYGILPKSILGKRRNKELVKARHIAAYLFREELKMSYPKVGRKIGARDHTTAIHAYQKVKNNLEKDPVLRQEIEEIKSAIRGSELQLLLKEKKAVKEADTGKSPIKISPEIEWKEIIKKAKIPISPVAREREKSMLEEWRAGKTLEQIGKEWYLTRERIRQITMKAILREIAEKVDGGLEIDVKEFLKYEKEKHITVRNQKLNKLIEKEEIQEPKRWSRYYASCKSCGTTVIPHHREGLCERCYYGISKKERKKIIEETGNKCSKCGIDRVSNFQKFGRDFYVTRLNDGGKSSSDYLVLCRSCFLKLSGKRMFNAKKEKTVE